MTLAPIFINGRFLSQRSTGVQRFAAETIRALDQLLGEISEPLPRLTILAPPNAKNPELHTIDFRMVGSFGGHLWEQTVLPWESRHGFLLSFGPTGPLLRRSQLVTIHDAAVHVVPEAYSRAFRVWYKLLLPILVRRTHEVATVSEFSRRELQRHFGAHDTDIRVVTEGWEHVLRAPADPSILAMHDLVGKPYVLAVSSVTAHKNFGVIAQALPELQRGDATIVVAGAVDNPLFSRLPKHSLDRLRLIGYVADPQLRALYENATAFVHPSRYEGFGLPPLEAMSLGCPVICSNAAALPETCGDAALYFAPDDFRQLATHIDDVLSNPELRAQLSRKGLQRVQHFGWKGTASIYLDLILGQKLPKPNRISQGQNDAERKPTQEQPPYPTG